MHNISKNSSHCSLFKFSSNKNDELTPFCFMLIILNGYKFEQNNPEIMNHMPKQRVKKGL